MAASASTRNLAFHGSSSAASLSNNPHRSSLKASNSQVRWPVNLNQLAAISLDDDSDFDRSLTDVSKDDIGSVKLLKMLKDSDDESTSAPSSGSRLRRPRSTYSNMQQQKQQLGNPATRASLQNFTLDPQTGSSTSIPKPQRTRSQITGSNGTTPSPSSSFQTSRLAGLRQHQSDVALAGANKRQSFASNANPEEMESIFSEAQALAKRIGASTGQAIKGNGPSVKRDGLNLGLASSLPSGSPIRSSVAGDASAYIPRKPRSSLTQASRLSIPSKLPASSSTPTLKTRLTTTAMTPGLKAESRSNGAVAKPEREGPMPSRIPGSPTLSSLPTPAARKLAGLQQQQPSSSLSRSDPSDDNQIAIALLPNLPISPVSPTDTQAIFELTEEIERWKTEAREHQRERAAAEELRKQITILERDLEAALDTLQITEGKLIQTKAEQDATQPQLASHEKTIQDLKAEIELAKAQAEEATAVQRQLDEVKTRNKAQIIELEQRLSKAHQEIEQLEVQAAPPELHDVQQTLFSATQELDESKLTVKRLETELAEEKTKVTREQEESGNLLVKLSQLQETIANQLRDNNTLKDQVKDHDKCLENIEVVEHKHNQEITRLQGEVTAQQKNLAQEQEQRSMLEHAYQEQQFQVHQLQQQVQLQQTQLLQQQTEIVNLRATLEVEQKQAALLQEQRINNPHFGRRVSLDGELNGSFLMIETGGAAGPGADTGSKMMQTQSPIHASYQPTSLLTNSGPGGSGSAASPSTILSPTIPQPGTLASAGGLNRSMQSNTVGFSQNQPGLQGSAVGLPPISPTVAVGGIVSSSSGGTSTGQMSEVEVRPRIFHRASSGSMSGILAANSGTAANNRLSMHGDPIGSTGGVSQSVEELTVQLQSLIKEKEK
ncbi:hypothetical protein BGZ83_010513, partial [Gryganskiella cystojenkinii]